MTTVHEGRHAGEFILSEANFHRSRGNVILGAAQSIKPGGLLARKAVPANVVATSSASPGNTPSSGSIAMDNPAVTSKVQDGRYIGIASAATKVDWSDPAGKAIGVSTHGAPFTRGGINFTITAGASPNVAGDIFYVDVAADAEDFQHVAFDPAGADGSELPVAVSIYGAITPADASAKISVIARDAEIIGPCIEWPEGITAAQRADAIQSLAASGIIVRT